MIVKRLYVDGYKCYSNFEMKFDGPCVFLSGTNGTGKTTLIEILQLLRDVSGCGETLSGDGKRNWRVMGGTKTRWLKSVPVQRFELDVALDGREYAFVLEVDENTRDSKPRVKSEIVKCDGRVVYSFVEGLVSLYNDKFEKETEFHADWSRSFLASVADRPENALLMKFKRGLERIVCIRPNPASMKTSSAQGESSVLVSDLSNFPSWFRYVKQVSDDAEYAEFLEDVKCAIDGLTGFSLHDAGDDVKELFVSFKDADGTVSKYHFAELSDGQRNLIALHSVLRFATRGASLICFDEPDNYLAISEVEPLIAAIRDCADEDDGVSVFVISHHPEFYRKMAMAHGYVLQREGGRCVRAKRASELLEKSGLKIPVADVFARGWEN